ncbi:hypothetical protein GQ44DRAFT_717080 [Phaeosphaeriaceae sp. PMI808]|nr:hypothetical protein GQ44DRAFT_717080 [Phaeosphaeriaceae sp. PMI808]
MRLSIVWALVASLGAELGACNTVPSKVSGLSSASSKPASTLKIVSSATIAAQCVPRAYSCAPSDTCCGGVCAVPAFGGGPICCSLAGGACNIRAWGTCCSGICRRSGTSGVAGLCS